MTQFSQNFKMGMHQQQAQRMKLRDSASLASCVTMIISDISTEP